MPDELKLCPFCNGKPEFGATEDGGNFIECTGCGSSTSLRYSLMEDARPILAEGWNKRAQLAAPVTQEPMFVIKSTDLGKTTAPVYSAKEYALWKNRVRNRPALAAEVYVPLYAAQVAQDDKCWCLACNGNTVRTMMTLCPSCGNKRCPKASNHELACTGSNEPGQPGSVY
jgi:hypothetical protein